MGIVGFENFCTIREIINQAIHSAIFDISADGGYPVLLTRFLHNKLLYSGILTLRCYAHFFDPFIIAKVVSPYIVILFYYLLFSSRKNKYLMLFLLIFPILGITFPQFIIKTPIIKIYYLTLASLAFFYRFI